MPTAYTLAANATLRDIGNAGIWGVATARTGSDTIDTNGFTFTQDQDSRYGLGGNTSAIWANLTINATKGGQLNFDGTKVWLIPFTGGSGTLTLGTQITIGGVTCNTIGIYASLTTAPVVTGVAAGWIKVTNASGTPGAISSGTYAGYTITANGAAVRGWIEVNGMEAGTINANRLGSVNITGAWYEVGTTTGASNQTMQIPNNGLTMWHPGVFIETAASSGVFDFYPNAGPATTTGTDTTRGKCVWIDNTGLVRIGNSGAATNGYTPVTGLRVVIGNVFFQNVVTTLTANTIPHATIATRYDFTCAGGGVINIDKCSMSWYLSCAQAYSVSLTNSGFTDGILLSEVATAMTHSKIGIGNKATTALAVAPLTMTYCFAGGTFTDCVFNHATHNAAAATLVLTDSAGFTFTRCTVRANVIRGNAACYAVTATRLVNSDFVDCTVVQGSFNLVTCNDVNTSELIYCDCVSGTTVTTYAMYVWTISSNTINCTFSGLTLPITNTQPYTALLNIGAAGCSNIKLRSIGTYASPLTPGTVNIMGNVVNLVASAAASDIKVQRVYVGTSSAYSGGTRVNGIYYISATSPDNSSTRITLENVFTDYGDTSDLNNMLNLTRKGIGGTPALTAATSIYGTHFFDCHTSTTAGRLAIIMNEATSLTSSYVTLSGGAAFTSAGGLYMPTIGMQAIFELPYYCIGHTAFQNSAGIMAGGTATNYTYQYQIDKNDGAGFSAWSADKTATTLATALNGEASISAVNGFKVKIKITTSTGNATAITSFYLLTSSTATTQAYQYPLDVNTLTLTGVLAGSEIRCFTGVPGAAAVEIGGIESSSGDFVLTHSSGAVSGFITVINVDRQAFSFGIDSAFSYTASNLSLPVSQVLERNYTP
jgi:hypothetical protein